MYSHYKLAHTFFFAKELQFCSFASLEYTYHNNLSNSASSGKGYEMNTFKFKGPVDSQTIQTENSYKSRVWKQSDVAALIESK